MDVMCVPNVVTEIFETLISEKSRLLHVSESTDASINVSIVHEVLIRKWGRLKGWIDERREALEQKKRITQDVAAFYKGEEDLYGRGLSFQQHLLGKKKQRGYAYTSPNEIIEAMSVMCKTTAQGSQHIHLLAGLQVGKRLCPLTDNFEQYLDQPSFSYLGNGKRPAQQGVHTFSGPHHYKLAGL